MDKINVLFTVGIHKNGSISSCTRREAVGVCVHNWVGVYSDVCTDEVVHTLSRQVPQWWAM